MPRLLPRHTLIKTGEFDHADWNFRPLLGWISRRRFALLNLALPAGKVSKLLEIGYGSGILLPELSTRCEELHGIDVHPFASQVQAKLSEQGIDAQLVSGSAEQLPYATETFDIAVAVSSLEFIPNPAAAAREICRVLKPTGFLVLVTPGQSPLLDWGLKMLSGEDAKRDYGDRRQNLMPALLRHFTIDARRTFPPIFSRLLCLYTALRLRPIKSD